MWLSRTRRCAASITTKTRLAPTAAPYALLASKIAVAPTRLFQEAASAVAAAAPSSVAETATASATDGQATAASATDGSTAASATGGPAKAASLPAAAASPTAVAAIDTSRPLPPPPAFYKGHISRRGFIVNDPLPDRPPEDDIAVCTAYFDILVSHAHFSPTDTSEVTNRVQRLLDPPNWAMVLNAFSVRQKKAPATVVALIEAKILAEPTTLDVLTGNYLGALAFGFATQDAGSKQLYEALASRLSALGSVCASDAANIKLGLNKGGVEFPVGVTVVPDKLMDLSELS